ncbi:MAG: hypothetical protein ABI960_11005, partial [Candidatus Eisenbacteria bacterium]
MTPRMHTRFAAPIAAALLGLAAAGCGLFRTQTAESPIADSGIPPNFTLPESTFATMQRALNNRVASNFIICLADTALDDREFHATFDPADITLFEQSGRTAPNDWTSKNEQTFLPQFLTYDTNAKYDLRLSVDNNRGGIFSEVGPPEKRHYNMHYRVWAGGTPVAAG